MTIAAGTVTLNISYEDDSLFDNYEKVASAKKHTQHFQSRVSKPYPIYDQSGCKTLPFWGCTHPYSPYEGLAPPPPPPSII